MTKQQLKRWYAIAFVFLLCLALLLPIVPKAVHAAAVTGKDNKFDDTNVLDDLRSSDGFNILKYPFLDSGKPEMYVINVVEYCYSFKANMRGNYALYLYLYNPGGQNIDVNSHANKVQMAVAYDSEGKPASYEKFDLQFCTKSEETNYKNLFYKFKIIDHASADGKTVLERVNSNARRYDISGVELQTYGATNATDYAVGGSYIFTGYAAGYGSDSGAESTLQCDVRNLEMISLDLAGKTDGVDKRTFWRSNSSSLGKNHQNQINSVFFAIDKDVLERYGYTLQRIKAEWWEYKTAPAIVTSDNAVYNSMLSYVGYQLPSKGYDISVPYGFLGNSRLLGDSMIYNWSYNGYWKADYGEGAIRTEHIEPALYLLFPAHGNINEYVLSADTLKDYFSSYSKTYNKGHISFNGHDYSADLFLDTVDTGRTRGRNERTFDIEKPEDYWDIRSYDSSHNWWNKLWDYGFGGMTTNDDFANVSPIQRIEASDIAVPDLATHLKINADDINCFKDYYNAVKENKEVFIFRYAVTDYFAMDLTVVDSAGKYHDGLAELRQGTQFFDFDILEFTFNKEGIYTVIPVVSSPLDHWSSFTPSIDPPNDWWKILLMVLALILVLVLLAPFLPAIVSFLVMVITIPFKLIGALFRGIGKLFKKRKKE